MDNSAVVSFQTLASPANERTEPQNDVIVWDWSILKIANCSNYFNNTCSFPNDTISYFHLFFPNINWKYCVSRYIFYSISIYLENNCWKFYKETYESYIIIYVKLRIKANTMTKRRRKLLNYLIIFFNFFTASVYKRCHRAEKTLTIRTYIIQYLLIHIFLVLFETGKQIRLTGFHSHLQRVTFSFKFTSFNVFLNNSSYFRSH